MRQTLKVLGLTLLLLAVADGLVALALNWAERADKLSSLVRYFEYGRSVPGKLERWAANPDLPGNLYAKAWRPETVARSRKRFQAESSDQGSVVRSYGMSFVNHILENVVAIDPEVSWDVHGGPAAPPNLTFALFQEDRANRRAGDAVVLGVLSSSIPAMAALSNRTWIFEQPGPHTYPIFWPDGAGLRRVEPLINTTSEQRMLSAAPEKQRAWMNQLAEYDAFYSPISFRAVLLDASPFARLVRRSLVASHLDRRTAAILEGAEYPYAKVLRRMLEEFAKTARQDGQTPIVLLIQTRDPDDADVLEIAKPVLDQWKIPYFATAEHFDPADISGFLPDGHYKPEIDRMFAERMLKLLKD